jgi:hypothetical protein
MALATLTKPNITVNAVNTTGAGTGATASIAAGSTNLSGSVTVTPAGTPGAGTLATVSFTTLGGSDPNAVVASVLTNGVVPIGVLLTPQTGLAGANAAQVFATATVSGFTISAQAAAAVGVHTWTYQLVLPPA